MKANAIERLGFENERLIEERDRLAKKIIEIQHERDLLAIDLGELKFAVERFIEECDLNDWAPEDDEIAARYDGILWALRSIAEAKKSAE